MELWLDAQLSPLLAKWIREEFSFECYSLRELGLRNADDAAIFKAAKAKANVCILTKDEDFVELLFRLQAPPKIIWLTMGNRSNTDMKTILSLELPKALVVLQENDLVEISG
ncbi:MAG: DUF5615 family PIN-like protein [Chitinophagales bacterium]|nr:DUF5615 family PIN-like protein [Chitinophagales bacterium]